MKSIRGLQAACLLVALSAPAGAELMDFPIACREIVSDVVWMRRDGSMEPLSTEDVDRKKSVEMRRFHAFLPYVEPYRGVGWFPKGFDSDAVQTWFRSHAPAERERVAVLPNTDIQSTGRLVIFPDVPCENECQGLIAVSETEKVMVFRPFLYRSHYARKSLNDDQISFWPDVLRNGMIVGGPQAGTKAILGRENLYLKATADSFYVANSIWSVEGKTKKLVRPVISVNKMYDATKFTTTCFDK